MDIFPLFNFFIQLCNFIRNKNILFLCVIQHLYGLCNPQCLCTCHSTLSISHNFPVSKQNVLNIHSRYYITASTINFTACVRIKKLKCLKNIQCNLSYNLFNQHGYEKLASCQYLHVITTGAYSICTYNRRN